MGKRSPEGIVRERIRIRNRMKAVYDERILAGQCYKCGVQCEINIHTRRPFHACEKHRAEWMANSKKREERYRAGMVELADTTDLKSVGRNTMRVRSSLPAAPR